MFCQSQITAPHHTTTQTKQKLLVISYIYISIIRDHSLCFFARVCVCVREMVIMMMIIRTDIILIDWHTPTKYDNIHFLLLLIILCVCYCRFLVVIINLTIYNKKFFFIYLFIRLNVSIYNMIFVAFLSLFKKNILKRQILLCNTWSIDLISFSSTYTQNMLR